MAIPVLRHAKRVEKPGIVTVQRVQAVQQVKRALRRMGDPSKAAILQRFFKTGKGEYGEGDRFIGVTVPALRQLCRQYPRLPLAGIRMLLRSCVHEERLFALLWLVLESRNSPVSRLRRIYKFYLAHTRFINNWDLVDLSAGCIVGSYLRLQAGRAAAMKELTRLARSRSVWERRIAVVATIDFIRANQFKPTLTLARLLLGDSHDLMHKAVGWMLREVGKRDRAEEEVFLKRYYRSMPRTMLRYAIERFPQRQRRAYLDGRA